MNIRIRHEDSVAILCLEGRIDINSANLIEACGQILRDGFTKILCNLKSVEMIDYNGLSIIAIAYKMVVNRGGIMKFSNVSMHSKELLKVVRLDLVFDIYDEEHKALVTFDTLNKIDKLYLRRRFKRLEFYHPVKYDTKNEKYDKKFSGKLLNVSGAGIYVYSKNIFPISTRLSLELHLDNNKQVEVDGIVIWLSDKEIQPHCYPGMGVQFIDISSDIQKEILDYIDKNLSSRSDL